MTRLDGMRIFLYRTDVDSGGWLDVRIFLYRTDVDSGGWLDVISLWLQRQNV